MPSACTYVQEDRHALGQLQGRAELLRGVAGGRRRPAGILRTPWGTLHPCSPAALAGLRLRSARRASLASPGSVSPPQLPPRAPGAPTRARPRLSRAPCPAPRSPPARSDSGPPRSGSLPALSSALCPSPGADRTRVAGHDREAPAHPRQPHVPRGRRRHRQRGTDGRGFIPSSQNAE